MNQIVVYRQYWMATLKDRHCCQICGDLAITALEFVDKNGIRECDLAITALEFVDKNGIRESVSWFCDPHLPIGVHSETQGVSS